jgi:DNA-binding transcriptional ArsR family regulator
MPDAREQLLVLADPTRLAVWESLSKGPAAVNQIARLFSISRPAVSQHLRVLKDAQLVIQEQRGTRRIYRLNAASIQNLRSYFDSFWDAALTEFQSVVESSTPNYPPDAAHPNTLGS